MKIKDVPSVDYRNEDNKNFIQQKVLELPFFRKYDDVEDISFEKLEQAMFKLQKRYPIKIGYIQLNTVNEPFTYSMMIKHATTHAHIETVYAASLREGFEKILLFGFYYCKKFFSEE